MAVVPCPICGQPVPWVADSRHRPFCSERCKNVDLGAWASERYAIGDGADGTHDAQHPDRES